MKTFKKYETDDMRKIKNVTLGETFISGFLPKNTSYQTLVFEFEGLEGKYEVGVPKNLAEQIKDKILRYGKYNVNALLKI
jgi:hypothetical protein